MKPDYLTSPLDDLESFQLSLVSWFKEVAEPYAWRGPQDPYEILVSEVMLQQTTIQAVVENRRYEKFLEQFPTAQELATASEQEILSAWEGLGYYNRVRNLQKTARVVTSEYGGVFPETLEGLQRLAGIGPYTSAAVASFAYNLPAPLVDANVSRVFSRLFDQEAPIDDYKGQKWCWGVAKELVSQSDPRLYNAALMELGQKVCRNTKVHCQECPIHMYCRTRDPLKLPVKKPKKATEFIVEHVLYYTRNARQELLLEQEKSSRRKGMWLLPQIDKSEAQNFTLLNTSTYGITHYKVTLNVYEGDNEIPVAKDGQEWVRIADVVHYPMPSPYRKVVEKLLQSLL